MAWLVLEMRNILSYVKEAPGVRGSDFVTRGGAGRPITVAAYAARALRHPPAPHQPANRGGCGERHGSQYALPVVIDCHPILWRRWRPG